jgi:hypothetical protein
MRFTAVYHVATLNHWREVVAEQLRTLLRNVEIASLFVTIGADSTKTADSCAAMIATSIQSSGRGVALRTWARWLDEFEHPAMDLIDSIAKHDDAPILYFHTKGVGHSPPNPFAEKWRWYLNTFIAQADTWAAMLREQDYDACGPLKLFDPQHGYTYFAGNFWMAKAEYIRRLPSYSEFARNPGSPCFRPFDRHLAEVAINRSACMRALAIDNTSLTPATIWPYLRQVGQ